MSRPKTGPWAHSKGIPRQYQLPQNPLTQQERDDVMRLYGDLEPRVAGGLFEAGPNVSRELLPYWVFLSPIDAALHSYMECDPDSEALHLGVAIRALQDYLSTLRSKP